MALLRYLGWRVTPSALTKVRSHSTVDASASREYVVVTGLDRPVLGVARG